jgi:hypothetical protein
MAAMRRPGPSSWASSCTDSDSVNVCWSVRRAATSNARAGEGGVSGELGVENLGEQGLGRESEKADGRDGSCVRLGRHVGRVSHVIRACSPFAVKIEGLVTHTHTRIVENELLYTSRDEHSTRTSPPLGGAMHKEPCTRKRGGEVGVSRCWSQPLLQSATQGMVMGRASERKRKRGREKREEAC